MTSDWGPTWLLFDGDCRVCSSFARWIDVLDLRGAIRIRPIQESRDLLQAVPPGSLLEAVHAVAPDGRVTTGSDALPLIVSALLDGPELEGLLRSSPHAMSALSRLYRFLVEFRGRLTCALDGPSSAGHTPR